MCARMAGIHGADQHLIFAGQELSNGRALSDYAVADGASLRLIQWSPQPHVIFSRIVVVEYH